MVPGRPGALVFKRVTRGCLSLIAKTDFVTRACVSKGAPLSVGGKGPRCRFARGSKAARHDRLDVQSRALQWIARSG